MQTKNDFKPSFIKTCYGKLILKNPKIVHKIYTL